MQSRRKRKTLILSILVVGLFVIWTVVPIYMLISQSVKPENIKAKRAETTENCRSKCSACGVSREIGGPCFG